jgi:biopolymer transport protein ExbD
MKKVKESGDAIAGVNIVPIIDVTLVLLVVLLVMSPVVNLPSMSVDLPEAITKETKDQNVSVSMSSDGKYSVDDKIVEWEQLPSAIPGALNEL